MTKRAKKSGAKKAQKRGAKKAQKKAKIILPLNIKNGEYIGSLCFNGETYSGAGATALEAFAAIKAPVGLVKTKATIRLEKKTEAGMFKFEQIFFVVQVRRFISSATVRLIWAKRMEMRLKYA